MKNAILTIGAAALLNIMPAAAHEVSASRVKVVLGDGALEVWQTTPHVTAFNVAARLSETGVSIETDRQVLTSMAEGWQVSSKEGVCRLAQQAHRRVHYTTQLQLRYLFICPNNARPRQISMSWLMETSVDHFTVFELETSTGVETKILERQRFTLNLPDASQP